MAVIAGLQKNGVFMLLSEQLLKGVKTTRGMCNILILLCFFSSMWITNDVALITFVPFSILILNLAGKNKYLIYVIVMQTIAANLGSILTPVGNPQNLYLYSYYHVNSIEFLKITLPLVMVSLVIIGFISLFVKREKLTLLQGRVKEVAVTGVFEKIQVIRKSHTIIYLLLFILCIGTVIDLVDYQITFIIVLIVIGLLDKKVFHMVDYSLLLTFVCFFIFVGNLGNIETVQLFIANMIKTREIIASILLSQIISNVPAAVLLSNFTEDSTSLIVGTNIGGLGTIIASLASLISYKIYCKTDNAKPVKYLGVFTVANVGILFILCLFLVMSGTSIL